MPPALAVWLPCHFRNREKSSRIDTRSWTMNCSVSRPPIRSSPSKFCADDVGVLRLRVPAVALVRDVGLVEESRRAPAATSLQRVHPVLDVLGRLEAVARALTAEAADVGFVAPAVGDLGPLALRRLQRRFGEEQLLAERAREHALVGAEPLRPGSAGHSRPCRRSRVASRSCRFSSYDPKNCIRSLTIGPPSETPHCQRSNVGLRRRLAFHEEALRVADDGLVLHEALVLVEAEELAREPVAAALGDRR